MKRYIYFIALILVLGTGCKKDYFDINKNPNSATSESITPDLILPQALTATASITATEYDYLGRWMGYWARGGDYGPNAEEESYIITTSFSTTGWSNWYNTLNDYDVIQKKAAASGQKFHEAIARTMKTVGFMYLVDTYNNVPYSKAFDFVNNVQPAYDKGEDIYTDLFKQLDTALVLLDGYVSGVDNTIETTDIMFHGNIGLWKKFINTHRLKLTLHESAVPGFDAAAQIAKITADGFLGSGETAAINPGYKQGLNQQNPFWNVYDRDYTGEVSDKYNRANNFVLNSFFNTNDIRYQYFFAAPEDGTPDYSGYDYGASSTGQLGSSSTSGVYGPGVAHSAAQDQWLLTSTESLFLQAEAIQQGLLPGDAEAAYKAAVTESFVWLGVPDATTAASDYLTAGATAADPNIDWASATDKMALIIWQKYLSNIGIDNFETWDDYRRLGLPDVPHSVYNGAESNIPLRLRYPLSEYNYNAPNAEAEDNPDPQTSGIFWDL